MAYGRRIGATAPKASERDVRGTLFRAGLTLVGALLVSPLPIMATSQLEGVPGLAVIAVIDVAGTVALAAGLRSASRAAIAASLLSSFYFLQAGMPEVGPWANLFGAVKAPIYLAAGLIGIRHEERTAVRWAGVALPAVATAYMAWGFL